MLLERYRVTDIVQYPPEGFHGRTKIMTSVNEITEDNVREVLEKALSVHSVNASQIQYLWNYYRGMQDIRFKTKQVREGINNKVTVNRANEIVTFKTAFLLAGQPVQYVSHGGDNEVSVKVNRLNEYMRAEAKEAKDKEIVEWVHICGVAPRMVLPDPDWDDDGAPFNIYTLDPREAFVIYSSRIGRRRMAGVILQRDENEKTFATVYTKTMCFTVTEDEIVAEPHIMGEIPIVEYINNAARMGAFEPVISILNNINVLESNAVDAVQDFVNGFDVFQNCEVSDGDYANLSIGGKAIKVKTVVAGMEAKVYRVVSELSQSGVQTRIDDLSDAYLEICGMPNRNGGSSTSDTGTAVLYRDGWSAANSRAADTATLFKRSEREFDKVVLRICDIKDGLTLKLSDFDVKFPFNTLRDNQSTTQTFIELLNNSFVHPKCAYEVGAGLFHDPEDAYRLGMEWYGEHGNDDTEAPATVDSAVVDTNT